MVPYKDDGPPLKSPAAATYIGMSDSWLRQDRMLDPTRQKGPPYLKYGKAVRYLRADLDRWLEARRYRGAA